QERAGCRIGQDYPGPMVDHLAAAREARHRLVAVRRGSEARSEGRSIFLQHGSRRRGASLADRRRVGDRDAGEMAGGTE
ncbi:MAG: deoxyribodipyrimidine photolyase, partial [Bdellovibrio bacteriovorus]